MIDQRFILLGIGINAIGIIYYLIDTIKGKIKPHKVTFLMWSLAAGVAFLAQISQGIVWESLLTLSIGLSPLAIFIASFLNKKSHWELKEFDFACGALSMMGLILWQITSVANIAILFAILTEGAATLPTITKSYTHPETELAWTYLASAAAGVITLLIIKDWSFANYSFAAFYTIEMLIVYVLAEFKIGKLFT